MRICGAAAQAGDLTFAEAAHANLNLNNAPSRTLDTKASTDRDHFLGETHEGKEAAASLDIRWSDILAVFSGLIFLGVFRLLHGANHAVLASGEEEEPMSRSANDTSDCLHDDNSQIEFVSRRVVHVGPAP